jgi:transcriptional regulator with XRE-family HTH domain
MRRRDEALDEGCDALMTVDAQTPLSSVSDTIAAHLRSLRGARGQGRDEVAAGARAAGAPPAMTAAALSNIETGRRDQDGHRRREVSVDELVWLAAALGVPVRQLLGEHADLFGHPATPARPPCGDVEAATRQSVEDLGDLAGQEPALAEASYALAAALDAGAGMSTAAVARELRATLQALWAGRSPDDVDDDDDLGPG